MTDSLHTQAVGRGHGQGQLPWEPSPVCTPGVLLETLFPAHTVLLLVVLVRRHRRILVGMVRPEEDSYLRMGGLKAWAQPCLASMNPHTSHPSSMSETQRNSLQRSPCPAPSFYVCCAATSGWVTSEPSAHTSASQTAKRGQRAVACVCVCVFNFYTDVYKQFYEIGQKLTPSKGKL